MSPAVVFLILYPIGMILLAYVLKYLLRKKRKANLLIYVSVYIFSNIAIAFFLRGGFKVSYIVNSGKGFAAFAGFTLDEWLRTILIPHVFTLLYIFLIAVSFVILQKTMMYRKLNIMEKHDYMEKSS